MRLLVLGGSDAGIAAALRARELDASIEVTVALADSFPNYSICGLPYYVSRDVADWRLLAHRSAEELQRAGVTLLLEHTARAIDPVSKRVTLTDGRARDVTLDYDRLIVATGAVPMRPPIDGLELEGVHVLHTMSDCFAVMESIDRHAQGSALIVGGGYIGLEMAEALTARGLRVALAEQLPEVLPTLDAELGAVVHGELAANGVDVMTSVRVETIERHGGSLVVRGTFGLERAVDLILVVVGVRPDAQLAASAGARTGVKGAVSVSRRMETSVADVFAAGDCVETYHQMLDEPTYLPLGTTAHKQRRVAGRMLSAEIACSKAPSGRRSSRCSSSQRRVPGCATNRRGPRGSSRSQWGRSRPTTRRTTRTLMSFTYGSPATARPAACSAPRSWVTVTARWRSAWTSPLSRCSTG